MAGIKDSLIEAEEDTQSGRFLTFKVEKEYYGIEIKYVVEIINIMPITKVPGLPGYIKGIINLRGRIIPVMDVRLRFNLDAIEYNDRTCIVVVLIDGMDIGLIVDGVSDVTTIPETDILPPPEISKAANRFINGIGKAPDGVILLLDYRSLLNIGDAELITEKVFNV
jgi:purine-binding chemotaxis protein CheW